jgi:hypothetical protein
VYPAGKAHPSMQRPCQSPQEIVRGLREQATLRFVELFQSANHFARVSIPEGMWIKVMLPSQTENEKMRI